MIAKKFSISEKFKMKLFFLNALITLTIVASSVFSQTTKSVPTPPQTDDDTVKISTSLIQIDVTVTDKNGTIVSDLKPDEIEIYENGKKQELSNFSFISNLKTPNETLAAKPDNIAAPIPPKPLRPEQVRRTIALVVDDLTLSFESTHFVRMALKKFVDEQMRDGDFVAIVRTGGGIGALQQFTTDRRQLYAAIEKLRWNPIGSGKIGAFAPIEATPLERMKATGGEVSDEQLEAEKRSIQGLNDFRGDVFATGTLGALDYIVRGMRNLPGRKSVMLLSDGFKLFTKDESGFMDSTRVLQSLRRLIDLANRASVVVYTMDARGLQTLGATAADDTSSLSAEQIESRLTDRRNELFDTQDGLVYLARQTGGLAIVNNNDLSGGIGRMIGDQSYYLIGYQPDDETFDPKTRRYNKLEIKVNRPGTRVRYRSGFFGISDEETEKQNLNLTAGQRMTNALTSPFAVNDIALRLNALFGSGQQGAFIRSFLHINAQDLKFTDQPDNTKKAVFDIAAVSFGDTGVPIDQVSNAYEISVKKDQYDEFLKSGFVYDFTFPIKKAGAYQLRVALLDKTTDKVGAANQFIEVPDLKKERLTLSGIVLENMSLAEWQAAASETAPNKSKTSPLSDTALRQFNRGTVLNYSSEIYNAKLDAAKQPNLTSQMRLFRDGVLFFEGKQQKVPANQANQKAYSFSGSLNLGTAMKPGDYVLQIVITDNLAKEKRKISTQFVQFELIN